MKRELTTLLLLALPLFFFTSCDKEDLGGSETGNQPGDTGEIIFDISFAPYGAAYSMDAEGHITEKPQTRAATDNAFNTTWEDGDEIGLFAVAHGSSLSSTLAENYINNMKLTYSSADGGKWTPETDLWWPDGKLDFYAYYPYNVAATDPTNIAFNVLSDQSGMTNVGGMDKPNYNLSDLLTSKTTKVGGYGKGEAVTLQFSHALALVQVEFKTDRTNNEGPAGRLKVMLRGLKTGATLNLGGANPSVAATDGTEKSVTMHAIEKPDEPGTYIYRALVPAQAIAADMNLFSMEQFNELYFHKAAAITLVPGVAKRYEISGIPFMPLAEIEKGTFQMGSPDGVGYDDERPQHEVTLTQDFWMGKYQVTREQYAAFLNAVGVAGVADGSSATHTVSGYGKQPLFTVNEWGWTPKWNAATSRWESSGAGAMIYVTWYGAKAYADWVGGFLPTEAQWEYACRAGTTTAYSFGDDAGKLGDYGWYSTHGLNGPKDVGLKLPNPWGLYDMHGNIFEWCNDWYKSDYYGESPAENPTGPDTGYSRVLRGGGWGINAQRCRSAYRGNDAPGSAYGDLGFRVVFVP